MADDTFNRRWLFPAFNAAITVILGGGLGFLLRNTLLWVLGSLLVGVISGLVVEYGLGNFGQSRWLYRRRALLLTLVEVPVFLFVVGPWVFVDQMTQPRPSVICCETPADFGADYEDVRFEAADGIRLAGWYLPPPNDSGAVIIVLHGIGGNRMGSILHAEQLYAGGYGVLLYDERALGESEGAMQSFGWLDVADVSAAVDFVLTQDGVVPERIGIVGLSLGGHIALPAAAHDERLAAVWAEGVAAQHFADFPPPRNSSEQIQRFYYGLLDTTLSLRLAMRPEPIVDVIGEIAPRPLMLVAGGRTQLEARTGERYAQLAGPTAELWLIPDGGHIDALARMPEAYRTRLIGFFDRALVTEG